MINEQGKLNMQRNNFSIWLRFKKNPLKFCNRVVSKLIIEPIKYYGGGKDYNAKKYWDDRFSKYGFSNIGPGDEGLTEEENKKRYAESSRILITLFKLENIQFNKIKVLEVGCGAGFYAQVLKDLGVKNYTGLDISDVLFPGLKERFPEFNFIRKDITSDMINDKFDLIIMVDVILHIVTEKKLSSAMENIKNSLKSKGAFIVVPIFLNESKRYLFYSRYWSLKDIKKRFIGYEFKECVKIPDTFFKGSHAIFIKNSA